MSTLIREIESVPEYGQNSIMVYSPFDTPFKMITTGNIYVGLKISHGKGGYSHEYVELDEAKIEELLIAIQYAQLHSKTRGEMR